LISIESFGTLQGYWPVSYKLAQSMLEILSPNQIEVTPFSVTLIEHYVAFLTLKSGKRRESILNVGAFGESEMYFKVLFSMSLH
jgi:hypothetical protein